MMKYVALILMLAVLACGVLIGCKKSTGDEKETTPEQVKTKCGQFAPPPGGDAKKGK